MNNIDFCDSCNQQKETQICWNEISWGTKCNKNICDDCLIPCKSEGCVGDNYGSEIFYMCKFCYKICNKCKKNICYRCEEKLGRCKECWSEFPLCDFFDCENKIIEANYQCSYCYKYVCYEHKKRCYNCGLKCAECHENYSNATCNDCVKNNDFSTKDVDEPIYTNKSK